MIPIFTKPMPGPAAARNEAQSYTLVHFLTKAGDGKYRKFFAEYLLSSYKGKGAVTHFEKIFGDHYEGLQAEYTAYVAELAAN